MRERAVGDLSLVMMMMMMVGVMLQMGEGGPLHAVLVAAALEYFGIEFDARVQVEQAEEHLEEIVAKIFVEENVDEYVDAVVGVEEG